MSQSLDKISKATSSDVFRVSDTENKHDNTYNDHHYT